MRGNKHDIVLSADDRTGRAIRSARKNFDSFRTSVDSVKNAVNVGMVAAGAAIGVLAKNVLDTTLKVEAMERAFKVATGSVEAARMEMDWVSATASRMGLDVEVASQQFSKLLVSAKGTSLAGKQIRDVFKSVGKASVAMGLSADDTSGVFMALRQMIDKGKVSMEELRQQLGERLPGAFKAAATGMGLTTAELDEFVSQGLVTAEMLLPAMAKELDNTFGKSAKEAAKSTQGSINKIKNSYLDLKKMLMGPMQTAMKSLAEVTTTSVNLFIEGFKSIRISFLEWMKTLHIGWERLSNVFDNPIKVLKKSWMTVINEMKKGWAEFIQMVATGLDSIPRANFFGHDLGIPKSVIANMRREAKEIQDGIKPISDVFNQDDPELERKLKSVTDVYNKAIRKAMKENRSIASNFKKFDSTDQSDNPDDPKRNYKEELERKKKEKAKQREVERTLKSQISLEKKLRSEADSLVNSFATQEEQLRKQLERLEQLYEMKDSKGNPLISEEDFFKTKIRIISDIDDLQEKTQEWGHDWSQTLTDMALDGELTFSNIGAMIKKQLLGSFLQKQFFTPLMGGFGKILGFADGGDPPVGVPSIVGERGPELFIPKSAGTVIPAGQTQAMLSGGSGQTVIHHHWNLSMGVTQTVQAEIQKHIPMIERRTTASIMDAKRRGGSRGSFL